MRVSDVSRAIALGRLRSQRYLIYALVDPRDDLPHYIGRSVNAAARLDVHRTATGSGARRCEWLRELAASGHGPLLRILDVARGVAATISAEQRWVDFGRKLGWPLTNRPGGARGGVWSLGGKRHGMQWSPRDFERELSRAGVSR